MKVLVTGAAGFLGSWMCEILVGLGHSVTGVDNLRGGEIGNLNSTFKLSKEDRFGCFDFKAIDLDDLPELTFATSGCDAVLHCAALAYEGLSVFSPSQVVENIMVGSVNVMVAAIRAGVKRFVNCSSMARYGNIIAPFREAAVPYPVDPYGIAKLAAERQLTVLGEVHGVRVIHAVPHNIIGARQKFDDPYRNVASIMANLMLRGKPAHIYGDGQQVRCFSSVHDVVPVLMRLLIDDHPHGSVWNVGPDSGEVTINHLHDIMARLCDWKGKPIYLPARPCEVKHAMCSSAKIRRELGWQQRHTLEQTLAELVDGIRQRGPRPFVHHVPLEIDSPKAPKTWRPE